MKKIYCFIRKDLPLAQQIVQACHASIAMASDYQPDPYTHFVLLQVENESDIMRIMDDLDSICKYQTFWEAGPMGFTSICTEPVEHEYFNQFELWKWTWKDRLKF